VAEQHEDLREIEMPPTGRLFVLGWILAIVAVVAASAGLVMAREFWVGRQAGKLAQKLDAGRRVLVMHVIKSPPSRTIELPGGIHGFIETPIYAKVSGYLKRILVDKGQRVKQGQLLAILESPELDQQVANALANYKIAAITDERNQELLRQGVVPQQTADETHATMLQNLATYRQLKAMQAYEIIRAPFSGLVTARYVDEGALIPATTTPAAAATPIVAMATLTPLRIYADVPQTLAPFVRNGDPAQIRIGEYPHTVFVGTVTRHAKALNIESRTMLVEVDLPNEDHRLLPGMYARVTFKIATPAGIPSVPDDALIFRDGKIYVPVVRSEHLRLAEVTLGNDNGKTVEIRSGISPDDLVAIDVGQAVEDGEKVIPVLASPSA
jgi:RND family efflux transporter MFP subunit